MWPQFLGKLGGLITERLLYMHILTYVLCRIQPAAVTELALALHGCPLTLILEVFLQATTIYMRMSQA